MAIACLAIVGLGLIGGSLALALRQANLCTRIIGIDRDEDSLKQALNCGAIDDYMLAFQAGLREVDVVVIATPPATIASVLQALAGVTRPDAVITDVGGVKRCVVEAARRYLGDRIGYFVPGHPIAGTEKNGMGAAFAQLFVAHRVILTPLPDTHESALSIVTQMWEASGANVHYLAVDHHDAVLAATSHLPHLLAYGLVDCLSHMADQEEILQYAAGGFADFTRIASSSPEMWHDICLLNRTQLLVMLERFNHHIVRLRQAIENNDSAALQRTFVQAKAVRDQFADLRKSQV